MAPFKRCNLLESFSIKPTMNSSSLGSSVADPVWLSATQMKFWPWRSSVGSTRLGGVRLRDGWGGSTGH